MITFFFKINLFDFLTKISQVVFNIKTNKENVEIKFLSNISNKKIRQVDTLFF